MAFKANIDDLRESPAVDICLALASRTDGSLLVVEPNINSLPVAFDQFENLKLCSVQDAIAEADIVVGLVDHTEFRTLSRESLVEKVVIDTRGMWR